MSATLVSIYNVEQICALRNHNACLVFPCPWRVLWLYW